MLKNKAHQQENDECRMRSQLMTEIKKGKNVFFILFVLLGCVRG